MRTQGWDTVSLIDIATVNAALASQSGSLWMKFDTDLESDPPVKAVGDYQKWSIVPGGSERLLYLAMEIKNGTLDIGIASGPALLAEHGLGQQFSEPRHVDLAGVTAVIAIDLKLVAGSIEQSRDLVFNIKEVNLTMPPPGPGYVTPVKVLDPAGKLDVASSSLLLAVLADDLVRHADQVRFIFAHINPVPPTDDGWLAPTSSAYSFVERIPSGKGYLGIMSMTEGRSMDGLGFAVDPDAIQDEYTKSLVISGDMILRNMILPVLPRAYQTAGDVFYFDSGEHRIRNHHPFNTFSVTSGAITYHPVIDQFRMRIDATGIRTEIDGRCDMKAGIWMSFHMNVWNQSAFNPQTKELTFQPDSNPIFSHNADIPWYFWFLGPISGLITELVVKIIGDNIASTLNDLLRNAMSITRNPPMNIVWEGSEGFDVQVAGLNDSLYLMGKDI